MCCVLHFSLDPAHNMCTDPGTPHFGIQNSSRGYEVIFKLLFISFLNENLFNNFIRNLIGNIICSLKCLMQTLGNFHPLFNKNSFLIPSFFLKHSA